MAIYVSSSTPGQATLLCKTACLCTSAWSRVMILLHILEAAGLPTLQSNISWWEGSLQMVTQKYLPIMSHSMLYLYRCLK